MARKPVPYAAKLLASLGIGAVMLGLCVTVYFAYFKPGGDDQFAQCRASTIAGSAGAIGGPFTLTDEDGNRVTETDVISGPTLVYFGYSYCPDVCPFDAVRNAEAAAILREQGTPVGDVFITIDPERDTPEVMKEFTDYFDEEMVGLTGSKEDISAVAKEYRVYFSKSGEGEEYLMDHSTLTYFMSPDVGLVEFFRRDLPAEEMADKIGCFLEHI